MPDENKFQALRDAGYSIPVTCGICVHGHFPTKDALWGTCGKIKYQHLKHTGPDREASIVRLGSCPSAALSQIVNFGHHSEFLDAKNHAKSDPT